MDRRRFIGLLTAMIAVPLTKIFSKWKAVKHKSIPDNWTGISPETRLTILKIRWLDGEPLGKSCNCKHKITVERGAYELWKAFKAYVTYCPKHGFNTDCYICNLEKHPLAASTEICNRNHKAIDVLISAPRYYNQ